MAGQNTGKADSFGARIIKWIDEDVVGVAVKVKKDIAVAVLSGALDRIPVKTGHARHNVQVSTTGPYVPELVGVDPKSDATFRREVVKLDNIPLEADVWITCGVPYGRRLEEGWSQQAPSGFLAVSVASARSRRTRR